MHPPRTRSDARQCSRGAVMSPLLLATATRASAAVAATLRRAPTAAGHPRCSAPNASLRLGDGSPKVVTTPKVWPSKSLAGSSNAGIFVEARDPGRGRRTGGARGIADAGRLVTRARSDSGRRFQVLAVDPRMASGDTDRSGQSQVANPLNRLRPRGRQCIRSRDPFDFAFYSDSRYVTAVPTRSPRASAFGGEGTAVFPGRVA